MPHIHTVDSLCLLLVLVEVCVPGSSTVILVLERTTVGDRGGRVEIIGRDLSRSSTAPGHRARGV